MRANTARAGKAFPKFTEKEALRTNSRLTPEQRIRMRALIGETERHLKEVRTAKAPERMAMEITAQLEATSNKLYQSAMKSGAKFMQELSPAQRRLALAELRTIAVERGMKLSELMHRLNSSRFRHKELMLITNRMAFALLISIPLGLPLSYTAMFGAATAAGIAAKRAIKWSELDKAIAKRMEGMSPAELGRFGENLKSLTAAGARVVNSPAGRFAGSLALVSLLGPFAAITLGTAASSNMAVMASRNPASAEEVERLLRERGALGTTGTEEMRETYKVYVIPAFKWFFNRDSLTEEDFRTLKDMPPEKSSMMHNVWNYCYEHGMDRPPAEVVNAIQLEQFGNTPAVEYHCPQYLETCWRKFRELYYSKIMMSGEHQSIGKTTNEYLSLFSPEERTDVMRACNVVGATPEAGVSYLPMLGLLAVLLGIGGYYVYSKRKLPPVAPEKEEKKGKKGRKSAR